MLSPSEVSAAGAVKLRHNTERSLTTKNEVLHAPAYPIAEAARYLRVSSATLRSWFVGRPYPTTKGTSQFRRVLQAASEDPTLLSFSNLVEAHVLRSLRSEHGVPLAQVRQALEYAEKKLHIQRLLLHEELRTAGGKLFLDRFGELVNLSASGQLAMREVFEAHLDRVAYGKERSAVRLYPFVMSEAGDTKPIVIDPSISFGRPVVDRAFVSTRAIAERLDAGESIEDIAADYELTEDAVRKAALFERAAA